VLFRGYICIVLRARSSRAAFPDRDQTGATGQSRLGWLGSRPPIAIAVRDGDAVAVRETEPGVTITLICACDGLGRVRADFNFARGHGYVEGLCLATG
jgi:hypothetical protein